MHQSARAAILWLNETTIDRLITGGSMSSDKAIVESNPRELFGFDVRPATLNGLGNFAFILPNETRAILVGVKYGEQKAGPCDKSYYFAEVANTLFND
ncbi:MAG: hypothetical protein ACI92Z_003119 [Paracoccaceae bacterium]